MQRRDLIKNLTAGTLLAALPTPSYSLFPTDTVKFGIVADVHKDLMPDADGRLQKFIDTARNQQCDFIIQLGDFCFAGTDNLTFMSIWEQFNGPKYHVLGNHDMDKNNKEEMLDFWGMPAPYYSFDTRGVHFVILDANYLFIEGRYVDYENANFYVSDSIRTYVNQEQIEWLKTDLLETSLPTIVFSHQSLWHYQHGIKNRLEIQRILEAQQNKIICCLNGHNHNDFHCHLNGIDYIDINSMSYQWMSDEFTSRKHFKPELYDQFSNLHHIAPYKDPLFAMATLHSDGSFTIEGVQSEWVSPSPHELGMPPGPLGNQISAKISNYSIDPK